MQIAQRDRSRRRHACGELGRVIVGGVVDVPGATMFEKKVGLQLLLYSRRSQFTMELVVTDF